MPRSSVTRRSSGRSRPRSRVNMSASNRRVPPRCFPLSGWSISRSLHRCLSTACCCSLCPTTHWVSYSLCLGFRLCCRCLLAVRVAPVHLGFRPGFYTWAFSAAMEPLVMDAVCRFCGIKIVSSMAGFGIFSQCFIQSDFGLI